MNEKIIITEPSSSLRARGRNSLEGMWKTAVLGLLIYEAILNIPPLILDRIMGYPKYIPMFYGEQELTIDTSPLSGIYTFVITGIFSIGVAMFFMAIVRRRQASPVDVFNGFEYALKSLGLFFMTSLFTALWSLLLVFPGIIAALRYSQAFFILADDPSKNIMQCINESKEMMMGNKGKLFCLYLSFIGWGILAGLASGIIRGVTEGFYITGLWTDILILAAEIPMLWVLAYITATEVNFYDMFKGRPQADATVEAEFTVVE